MNILKTLLPNKEIVKNDVLYLRRHYLTPRYWIYHAYLHLIAMPDEDRDPHDHPWGFWTLVLRGGYDEVVFAGHVPLYQRQVRAGNLLYRPPTFTHKIVRLHDNRPCWTLVLAGRTTRTWGFHTPKGFVPHHTYLGDESIFLEEKL